MRPFLVLTIAWLVAFTPGCGRSSEAPVDASVRWVVTFHTLSGETRTASLAVADTQRARERGLMGRRTLPPDGGEVFVFPDTTDDGFWMKNTPIPLSIAFWGEDGRVVDILQMTPCTLGSCPLYRSREPYTHALEMNAGWFSDHGVRIGDEVEHTVIAG
jgi:hypothetical protein